MELKRLSDKIRKVVRDALAQTVRREKSIARAIIDCWDYSIEILVASRNAAATITRYGDVVSLPNLESFIEALACAETKKTFKMVRPGIPGYEYVKNVHEANGYERCQCLYTFVVERGKSDYPAGIVEVVKGCSYEICEALYKKYSFGKYIVWYGTIEGGEVKYCWS